MDLTTLGQNILNELQAINNNTANTNNSVTLFRADAVLLLGQIRDTNQTGFYNLSQGLATAIQQINATNQHLEHHTRQNEVIICWLGIIADLLCDILANSRTATRYRRRSPSACAYSRTFTSWCTGPRRSKFGRTANSKSVARSLLPSNRNRASNVAQIRERARRLPASTFRRPTSSRSPAPRINLKIQAHTIRRGRSPQETPSRRGSSGSAGFVALGVRPPRARGILVSCRSIGLDARRMSLRTRTLRVDELEPSDHRFSRL